MALAEFSPHGLEGRSTRLRVRRYRENLARREAENEIKAYFSIGEPSAGLFPPREEDVLEASNVIFLADELKKREGDLAKRRKVVINTFLTKPAMFPKNETTQGLIERQIGRIIKFAKTLKNKGKLGSQMEKILEV